MLQGIAARYGSTREQLFSPLFFRSLFLAGLNSAEVPSFELLQEWAGMGGKQVVSWKEGEWRRWRER